MTHPPQAKRRSPPCARQGVSVLECFTSLILLGAMLGLVVEAVYQFDRLSRTRAAEFNASLALQNAAERIAAMPVDRISQDSATSALADEARLAGLTTVETTCDVVPLTEMAPAARVTLILRWTPPGDGLPKSLTLTMEHYGHSREGTS